MLLPFVGGAGENNIVYGHFLDPTCRRGQVKGDNDLFDLSRVGRSLSPCRSTFLAVPLKFVIYTTGASKKITWQSRVYDHLVLICRNATKHNWHLALFATPPALPLHLLSSYP